MPDVRFPIGLLLLTIGALLVTSARGKDLFRGHPCNLGIVGSFSHSAARRSGHPSQRFPTPATIGFKVNRFKALAGVSAVRPSRRPLCGLLRMRNFLLRSPIYLILRSAPEGRVSKDAPWQSKRYQPLP